jgi:4-amino-4-deoxy-L-arabinose transferase-like glycosyltransferase
MFKKISLVLIFIFCLFFFSYKLTSVPRGLTGDESAFGYNAILLSRNLRDENNRFLPVFVLSLGGKDWRQPVTQYFISGFFKVFGPSVYNLRFTSVIVVTLSAVLIFLLSEKLYGRLGAWLSTLFFITTPIIMIQSHLALDNIMPIPFILIWLLFLYKFEKEKNILYLVIAAISLGIGFYSYKGMRSFVPVWGIATVWYLSLPFLIHRNKTNFAKVVKPVSVFTLSLLPFFAVIPYLEFKYAGAVLSGTSFKDFRSIYQLFYYYLASYDPSFLFVSGDTISTHSTQTHGMLLLASLPFFLIGTYQSLKKGKFWKYLLICFFTGPMLFGAASSYHRASRLLGLIPIYVLICTAGALWFMKKNHIKRIVFLGISILLLINFTDFLRYYWYQYQEDYGHTFNGVQIGESYKFLYDESKSEDLIPFVSFNLIRNEDATASFLRSIYFDNSLAVWTRKNEEFPEKGILMTNDSKIQSLNKIDNGKGNMYFYRK